MNILVLEDSADRISFFTKNYIEDNLSIVNNIWAGISLLENMEFDIIFLDHDLGGDTWVDPNVVENTGTALAKYIAKCSHKKLDSTIIIHTWNSDQAPVLKEILESSEYRGKIIEEAFGTQEFLRIVRR